MKRIDMERLQEVVRLHRLGTSVREVARLLKMSPAVSTDIAENNVRDPRQAIELLLENPFRRISMPSTHA